METTMTVTTPTAYVSVVGESDFVTATDGCLTASFWSFPRQGGMAWTCVVSHCGDEPTQATGIVLWPPADGLAYSAMPWRIAELYTGSEFLFINHYRNNTGNVGNRIAYDGFDASVAWITFAVDIEPFGTVWLHGATENCEPADLDGSGGVDATDLALLLCDWGLEGSQADLNGDGTVDGCDLQIMLDAIAEG